MTSFQKHEFLIFKRWCSMAEKKTSKEETKAGMLAENSDSAASSEREERPEGEAQTTPKMSKNKALERDKDKPIH
jgi:hypothetical protein